MAAAELKKSRVPPAIGAGYLLRMALVDLRQVVTAPAAQARRFTPGRRRFIRDFSRDPAIFAYQTSAFVSLHLPL